MNGCSFDDKAVCFKHKGLSSMKTWRSEDQFPATRLGLIASWKLENVGPMDRDMHLGVKKPGRFSIQPEDPKNDVWPTAFGTDGRFLLHEHAPWKTGVLYH